MGEEGPNPSCAAALCTLNTTLLAWIRLSCPKILLLKPPLLGQMAIGNILL
jgi:hypothetical protein